ncbi:hypothetical protein D3C87_2068310 [compost metagenome]
MAEFPDLLWLRHVTAEKNNATDVVIDDKTFFFLRKSVTRDADKKVLSNNVIHAHEN